MDMERRRRYDEIIEYACVKCKNYRPKSKNQCTIYNNLLRKMVPEIVRQEDKFLRNGICVGYVYKDNTKGR